MDSLSPIPQTSTAYSYLIGTLSQWGVDTYAGVNGGGVFHFLKHLPSTGPGSAEPKFISVEEYSAGFFPLGHYLSSGRPAAAVATTGAATRLLCCALTDAKMHDIPSVYIVPIQGQELQSVGPVQDTSPQGSSLLQQLRAECPDGVFILDNSVTLPGTLQAAKQQLDKSKPVVFLLNHKGLTAAAVPVGEARAVATPTTAGQNESDIQTFIDALAEQSSARRLVLFVGEEASRTPAMRSKIRSLSHGLKSAVIWTMNGANAVDRDDPLGYGYIGFGGNDLANALYQDLGSDDVLLTIGLCPDEYAINLKPFRPGAVFQVGAIPQAYAQHHGNYAHRATGRYQHLHVPLDQFIQALCSHIDRHGWKSLPADAAPPSLNTRKLEPAREGYVDLVTFYQQLDAGWPDNSWGFIDICVGYKDRQYVTQRPNHHIQFYSLHRNSSMGSALGAGLGMRFANPDSPVFIVTGDGCLRLCMGALPEMQNMGLILFVLNNESFGLIDQSLSEILPELDEDRRHSKLVSLDWITLARACGWEGLRLQADLSNLHQVWEHARARRTRSLLVEVQIDPLQHVGGNPRNKNL